MLLKKEWGSMLFCEGNYLRIFGHSRTPKKATTWKRKGSLSDSGPRLVMTLAGLSPMAISQSSSKFPSRLQFRLQTPIFSLGTMTMNMDSQALACSLHQSTLTNGTWQVALNSGVRLFSAAFRSGVHVEKHKHADSKVPENIIFFRSFNSTVRVQVVRPSHEP